MRMSMSTTVGLKRAALSTASTPLRASATTSMSGSPDEQHPEAGADHRLVVGDEHADLMRRPRSSGRRVREHEAAAGRGARAHLAAVDLDALAHADEPVAEAVARRRADAVVADLDLQLVGARSGRARRAWPARACLSAFVSPSWTIR